MPLDAHAIDSAQHVSQPAASTAGFETLGQGAPGFGEALKMTGGLLLVVLLIVGACLLLRRLGSFSPGRAGRALQVIDTQSLGGKERVTIVEVDGQWLVLGVSPQGVTTLHTLDRPATPPAAPAPESQGMPFAQALKQAARQSLKRATPFTSTK